MVLELGKTGAGQLVVLDEFYAAESHVEDVIARLEAADRPSGTLYCDHDPADIDTFRRAGYTAEPATKDLDAGITEVRKRLEADDNLPVADSQGAFMVGRNTLTGRRSATRAGSSPR